MGRRPMMAAAAAAVVVIVAVVVLLASGGKDAPPTVAKAPALPGASETQTLLEGLPQDGFVIGDERAPVTLLEYVDLQCPFCKAHQLEVQPKLIQELVRTKQARIALIPLAFLGADSVAARNVWMRMAERAGAWQFANLFFWNQGQENSGYVTDEFLARLVAEVPGATPADAAREPDPAHAKATAQFDALAQVVLGKHQAGTPGFAVGPTDGSPVSFKWINLYQEEPAADQLIRAVRKERNRVLRRESASPPGDTA